MESQSDKNQDKYSSLWAERIARQLEELRRIQPLVYAITNFVTMNDVANSLLAVGASVVMAQAPQEVPDIVKVSGAVLINLGTLTTERLNLTTDALKEAAEYNKPVVLDPVGAGGTPLRTEAAQKLISSGGVTIIRANLSEAAALAGVQVSAFTRGVDSVIKVKEPGEIGMEPGVNESAKIARFLGRVNPERISVITGQRDWASNGLALVGVDNGVALLRQVSGAGCMLTGLCAAFGAITEDKLEAAVAGLVVFGVAAELAAAKSKGPGSLRVGLLDELYNLTPAEVAKQARIVTWQG